MNKKLFLGILMLTTTISMYSQIEKKTILLGGVANFSSLASGDNLNILINPNSGLFVSDRVCLGISVPLIYLSHQSYWGLYPFARYYFKPKQSKSFYLSGSVGLTSFLENDHILNSDVLSLGLGHVWLLNQSVGFEAQFNTTTSFEDVDCGIYLGFQIYFNKANK